MPLKEADLKTFEAYKKAIKQDLPKLSAGNARFWIYRDIELPTAAGKKQKLPSFIAFVDDKAIKPFLKGKKLTCKGKCGLENGKVAFEPESGKVPYKLLKKSIPLLLGKQVLIPSSAEADEDVEDTEEQEVQAEGPPAKGTVSAQAPPPPPPPPPPASAAPAAGLAATWNKLFKDMQSAIAADASRKEPLIRAASGIPELIKANKVAEAKQKIEGVQQMLKAPAAAPASKQPPPSTGAPGLAATWNKLVSDVKAASAANPARKDALTRAAAGIPELIKANKTDEARKKMDALQTMLKAGAAPPPAQAAGTTELTNRWNALVKQMQAEVAANPAKRADIVRASAGITDAIRAGNVEVAKKLMDGVDALLKPNPRAKEYHERYAAIEGQLAEALKNPTQDAGRLRAGIAFANDKADAGDFETALKALKQLEIMVAAARAQSPESKAEAGTPYAGLVKYRKALLEFDKAKTTVEGRIQALAQAMTKSLPDDLDLVEIVSERLADLNEEIGDVIDAAMQAAENEASPQTAAVRNKIQKYLQELGSNSLIKDVDSNPLGVNVGMAATLSQALNSIRDAMPA